MQQVSDLFGFYDGPHHHRVFLLVCIHGSIMLWACALVVLAASESSNLSSDVDYYPSAESGYISISVYLLFILIMSIYESPSVFMNKQCMFTYGKYFFGTLWSL